METEETGTPGPSVDARIVSAISDIPGIAEITRCALTDAARGSVPDAGEYDLELGLSIEYGSSIPEICDAVTQRLSTETGFRMRSLDLCVDDISGLPDEPRDQ
jgi:uncharacterized alkaline shock family protein YloU